MFTLRTSTRVANSVRLLIAMAAFTMPPRNCVADASAIIYVDDDAPEGGDGLSWKTAHRYLQDALAEASDPVGRGCEVRVGQGLYKADQGQGITPGDQAMSFVVHNGIQLRGSFAGLGAPDPDAQDFEAFPTILSGDLPGDDGAPGLFENFNNNSTHVVTLLNVDSTTVIEGVHISSGSAPLGVNEQGGGGLRCVGGSPLIRQCVFSHNHASYADGGGLSALNAQVHLESCRFLTNRVYGLHGDGAGAYIEGGQAAFINCEFDGNTTPIGDGAAIKSGPKTTVIGCTFTNNHGGDTGGGAADIANAGSVVMDCHFEMNHGFLGGGALAGGGTIVNSTFYSNFVSDVGGGAVLGSNAAINCTFVGNTAHLSGGGAIRGAGTFINCRFLDNVAYGGGSGGGAAHVQGDADFINCVFSSNRAEWNHGSEGRGGAAYVEPNAQAAFTNCVFHANSAEAPSQPGGALFGNSLIVHNSILWENSPNQISGGAAVTYSCVQGGWSGKANIDLDPLFVDAPNADFHLSPGSPCIDSGDNFSVPHDTFDLDKDDNQFERVPIDLDSEPRFMDDPATPNTGQFDGIHPIVDLGPFEFSSPHAAGDVDGDGEIDIVDLLAVIAAWGQCPPLPDACPADFDSNGMVNLADLLTVVANWT